MMFDIQNPQREDRPMHIFSIPIQVALVYIGWMYQLVRAVHHGLRAFGF